MGDDKFGHNAKPIMKGFCCDYCNSALVLPAIIKRNKE